MNAFKRTQLLKRKTHKWYYLKTGPRRLLIRRTKHKSHQIMCWLEDVRCNHWYELVRFEPRFGFRFYYTKAKRNKTILPTIRVWRNIK